MSSSDSTYSSMHVVRFVVDGRHFALDVMAVQEVLQPRRCDALPGQPSFIEGLVELRGQFLPLMDLRRRFAGRAVSAQAPAKLLVVKCQGRSLALVVDSVGEVERLAADGMRKPPVDNHIGGQGSVLAVAQCGEEMVMVLSSEALLSESEFAALPG